MQGLDGIPWHLDAVDTENVIEMCARHPRMPAKAATIAAVAMTVRHGGDDGPWDPALKRGGLRAAPAGAVVPARCNRTNPAARPRHGRRAKL